MELCLSNQEKNFIIDGVQANIRTDGRGLLDFRPIFLESGVLATTNGSAKVQIDTTVLLVGVKAEMTLVENSSLCENRIRFFVDCSAVALPIFAGKGGNDYGEDVSKILFNAYNNVYAIPNIGKLILSKTYMWTIFVDIVILQYGGNIITAASIGVKAALADTKICEMIVRPADEGKFILDLPDDCKTWTLDIEGAPIIIGVGKIGEHSVVDFNEFEETCSSSILFVAVEPPACDFLNNSKFQIANCENEITSDDDCRILSIRKYKNGSLDFESIEEMISTGVHVARLLNITILNYLKEEKIRKEKEFSNDESATFLGTLFH